MGNIQVPSVAEGDSEISAQQSSQSSEQFTELRTGDSETLHITTEENPGRAHNVQHEKEECKGGTSP